MICEKCNKNPATLHMQQFINGTKTEIHLCQECSFKIDTNFSYEHLFQGILDAIQSKYLNQGKDSAGNGIGGAGLQNMAAAPSCAKCGMSYDEFKNVGKLGCEACYQAFDKEINALFKNVQGSTRHEGKYPQRTGVLLRQKRRADELRADLKKAVEEENFEEAARLRDIIKSLEVNQS